MIETYAFPVATNEEFSAHDFVLVSIETRESEEADRETLVQQYNCE